MICIQLLAPKVFSLGFEIDRIWWILISAWLRHGEAGNKKRANCFATLLQNELNSDVALFTNHENKTFNLMFCKTGYLTVGDKTCNIAIILYLTHFALITCLAGAKRGGGWGKKRTRSHQSPRPPLMQQCWNISCTFFCPFNCSLSHASPTQKKTEAKNQACRDDTPRFLFQHPA